MGAKAVVQVRQQKRFEKSVQSERKVDKQSSTPLWQELTGGAAGSIVAQVVSLLNMATGSKRLKVWSFSGRPEW